jgi:hypothetical protein
MGLFGRRHDDDDEMDEWAYELTRKDSFPLAATITGSIVILVVSVAINSFASHRHMLVTTLGAGTVVALLVWIVAFLVTLRRAPIGWKIGSFFAMIVIGLVAGVIGIGTAITALQDDMRAIAEIKVNPYSGLEMPDGGARGPISKAAFTYFKAVVDDAMKHRAALKGLGYEAMTSASALRNNPQLLSHCDQRATVTPMIEAYYARRRTAYGKFRADLSAIDIDENFRKGLIDGVDKAQKDHGDLLERAAANEHGQIGELIAMCQILARHRWIEQFGNIAFTNPGDLRDFQTHARRENDLAGEERGLMQESMSIMNAGRAQIRRSLF